MSFFVFLDVDFHIKSIYVELMENINNNYSFLKNEKNLQNKSKNSLPKIVGWVIACSILALSIPEGLSLYKKYEESQWKKTYNRYEAIGGRYYEGYVSGYVFDNPEDKNIQFIELIGSDSPIYLNHSEIPYTPIRTRASILEMNRKIFEALETPETSFLKVEITHYLNRVTKDRISVMISAEIIPPLEQPKMDMDSERTIFRHPDTFEVIPKFYYDEIMEQRKEKADFIEDIQNRLNKNPGSLSEYTKNLSIKH